jgi:hypothetical protein
MCPPTHPEVMKRLDQRSKWVESERKRSLLAKKNLRRQLLLEKTTARRFQVWEQLSQVAVLGVLMRTILNS